MRAFGAAIGVALALITDGLGPARASPVDGTTPGGQLPAPELGDIATAAGANEPATATVEAGTSFRGRVHQWFFGDDYRDLWTTPVRVPMLDLRSFTPVRRIGAGQSNNLALRGPDGRSWTFRGVAKDATRALPPELRKTIVAKIAQDQTASLHPASALVATPLLEAAGVLHVDSRLVVIPDDPRLGQFRAAFAGALGLLQEYPLDAEGDRPGFAGATAIVGGRKMLERLRASPADRVDSQAFLRARLMDLFIGDWDRHVDQWRFARIPGYSRWQPIPEDRDFAFCRFEGVVLAVARNWYPRWVRFGPEYSGMEGLTWQAWPLDRVILSDLDWTAWDEIAADLQRRLTDDVLEAAVRRLPEEYAAADGARLVAALRARRDALPQAAARFYRHLAEEVQIGGTDEPDVAEAIAFEDGAVEIRVSVADASGAPTGEPWFRRRFQRRETREVRIDLGGGDDRFVARGRSDVRVRVIGGAGDDFLDDSAGGRARLADSEGRDRVVLGSGTALDTRPYTPPPLVSETPYLPARDWGRQRMYLPWFSVSPELGLFLGAGVQLDRFAFRTHPYRSEQVLRGGFATGAPGFRAHYHGTFRRENSDVYFTVAALASQIEMLKFYGLGNETTGSAPSSFYDVKQTQLVLTPSVHVPLARDVTFSTGLLAKRSWTRRAPDTLVGRTRPYGSEAFGQLGTQFDVRLDTRGAPFSNPRAVLLAGGGSFRPALWDVSDEFGSVQGEVATHLTAPLRLKPTLALRIAGKRVFGRYPVEEAAYVGGDDTLRGYSRERFAGDAAAWGNAELRLHLGRYYFVFPGEYGVFALADTGRVWLDGERSHRWRYGAGGGFWFAYLDRRNTVSVAVAHSAESTGLYVRTGFLF